MPVRIAFILDEFVTATAGTESQLLRLLGGIDRRQFTPAVFLLRGPDRISPLLDAIEVQTVGIAKLASLAAFVTAMRLAWRLRRHGYRVAQLFLNDTSVFLPIFLRLAGIHVVVSRRDLGFWYTKTLLRVLRLQRFAVSAVVANANAVRNEVARRELYRQEKIHVIYNGADTGRAEIRCDDARRRLSIESTTLVLTMVANLKPLKRYVDLIASIPYMRQNCSELLVLIVGGDNKGARGPSHRSELEQYAQELGVMDCIRFCGTVSNVDDFIAAADVCVLCSETEGLSNALIEYMLLGRPVVATAVGGNVELVQAANCGRLVDVGRPQQLAGAVVEIAGSEGLRSELANNARLYAVQAFSTARMVKRHEALYSSLVT
jgi:glycosyltransferase involved in cell wall biosynthesis